MNPSPGGDHEPETPILTLAAPPRAVGLRPAHPPARAGDGERRGAAPRPATRWWSGRAAEGEIGSGAAGRSSGRDALTARSRAAPRQLCDAIARGELRPGDDRGAGAGRHPHHAAGVGHPPRRRGDADDPALGRQRPRGRAARRSPSCTSEDGAVQSYTYREPQGFRTVASPADATLAGPGVGAGGRAAPAGRRVRARRPARPGAGALRPGRHPAPRTTRRPRCASPARSTSRSARWRRVLRYRLFLHQMELETHPRARARWRRTSRRRSRGPTSGSWSWSGDEYRPAPTRPPGATCGVPGAAHDRGSHAAPRASAARAVVLLAGCAHRGEALPRPAPESPAGWARRCSAATWGTSTPGCGTT